jgi:DNA-binding response OmpR family regulator
LEADRRAVSLVRRCEERVKVVRVRHGKWRARDSPWPSSSHRLYKRRYAAVMGGLARPSSVSPSTPPARILVVEDEPRIRDITCLYLERAGYAVTAAADGRAALATFDADPPDLAIVDLLLPGLTGEALIRAIRDVSDVPILVASAKRNDEDRLHAFQLGADDYLTKPFNPVELVARVGAILRRVRPLEVGTGEPRSFSAGRLVVDPAIRRFVLDGSPGRLTPTETRILLALWASPGAVLDRERLLATTTRGTGETTRTIDVHVANLRRKLGDDPAAPWAIDTVPDVGYRWIAPPDAAPPRPAAPDVGRA